MVVGFIYIDNTEDHIDLYAGHTAAVARQNYDQTNALKQETQTRRDRMMNQEWWRILGLTNRLPPKPRLTTYESASQDTPTATSSNDRQRLERKLDDIMRIVQGNTVVLTNLTGAIINLQRQNEIVSQVLLAKV